MNTSKVIGWGIGLVVLGYFGHKLLKKGTSNSQYTSFSNGKDLPAWLLNNNPCNIKNGNGELQKFESIEHCISALFKLLIGYQKNQNANSIYDIIAKYRPEKDSNGIVEYSNYLVVVFNVEGNGEYINFEHEYTLKLFAYGMMCYEFGKTEIDKYITNNMIDNAYKML